METATKNRRVGIILHYVSMVASFIIAIIYTPIVLNKLSGTHEYAVYNFSTSIVAYLPLLSLGLSSSYIKFYTKAKHNDKESISSLNGLYFLVFLGIALIALTAGLIIAFNAKSFFNNETFVNEDYDLAKKIIIILTINTAISFPISLFTSYTISQEKFIFQRLISLFTSISAPVFSIVVLFMGGKTLAVSYVHLFVNVFADLYLIFFCFIKLKMKISFKNLQFWQLKEFFVFSIFVAINTIADQINLQTDKVILAKITNDYSVSAYSVGATINYYFMVLGGGFTSVFSPKINQIVESDLSEEAKNEELNSLYKKVGRIQFILLSLAFTGFIFFGQFFISKWSPGYENAYYVALILMAPMLFYQIQTLSIEIRRARNKHKLISLVYLSAALLNILITIPLIKVLGYIGAALGTCISILMTLLISLFYNAKYVNLKIGPFVKEILFCTRGLIIPALIGVGCFFISFSWWSFIFCGLLYVIIFLVSMYFLGLRESEKKYFSKLLNKIPFFKKTNINKMIKNNKKGLIIILISSIAVAGLTVFSSIISIKTPTRISIKSKEDFMAINNNLNGYFVLESSIVLDEPITIGDIQHPFTGTIDGDYVYTITVKTYEIPEIETTKYEKDNSLFFGLIPYNKGTIIHCNFSFPNLKVKNNLTSKNLFCGYLCGINEGKITSTVINSIGSEFLIDINNKNSIFFGVYCGFNQGEIRRDFINRNVIIYGDSESEHVFVGGFVGYSKNGVYDRCEKRGWIIVGDNCKLNSLTTGSFVGKSDSDHLINCYGGNINVGFNSYNTKPFPAKYTVGGFVGELSEKVSIEIENSCFLGDCTAKCGDKEGITTNAGSLVGKCSENSTIKIINTLVSGVCNSTGFFGSSGDICSTIPAQKEIKNSYALSTYIISANSSNVHKFLQTINQQDLSTKKLNWDNSIWSITDGKIIFKEFQK